MYSPMGPPSVGQPMYKMPMDQSPLPMEAVAKLPTSTEPPQTIVNGNPIMYEDPTLPEGWSRKVSQRTGGASTGKWDVYIVSPDGKKFRSRNELRQYLDKNGLDFKPEDFDFSLWGRGNRPQSNFKKASQPPVVGSPPPEPAAGTHIHRHLFPRVTILLSFSLIFTLQ